MLQSVFESAKIQHFVAYTRGRKNLLALIAAVYVFLHYEIHYSLLGLYEHFIKIVF